MIDIVFGVDPGKTGAMSIFQYIEEDNTYYLLHIVDYSNKSEVLYYVTYETSLFRPNKIHAFIENVHAAPGQSISAMFNFGQNLGWWYGLFDSFNIVCTPIAPQSWSPKMLGRTDDKKNKAREVATQLFSRDKDNKTDEQGKEWFSLKKYDGRADSALIAWYGIHKYILT